MGGGQHLGSRSIEELRDFIGLERKTLSYVWRDRPPQIIDVIGIVWNPNLAVLSQCPPRGSRRVETLNEGVSIRGRSRIGPTSSANVLRELKAKA